MHLGVAVIALFFAGDVRGERVLLLSTVDDELALRLHDELVADGFDVIERDPRDVVDAVGAARALDAFAVVEVQSPRIDLWCGANRTTADRVEHAVLDASLVDKDAAAVRAAEIVRARLLRPPDLERRSPSLANAATGATIHADPIASHAVEANVIDALDLGVSAQGVVASAGLPPTLDVAGSIDVVTLEHVVLGVDGALPAFASRITATDGDAQVSVASLHAFAGARFDASDDVDVAAVARAGPAFVSGAGRSTRNTGEHDAFVVVADLGVALELRYAIARPLFLTASAHVDTFAPTPAFLIGASTIAAGPVSGGLALGVTFAVPDLR